MKKERTNSKLLKIGNKVRKARKLLGFSQQRLCDKVGICKPSLIHLEKGRRAPKFDKMLKIMKAVKVDGRAFL